MILACIQVLQQKKLYTGIKGILLSNPKIIFCLSFFKSNSTPSLFFFFKLSVSFPKCCWYIICQTIWISDQAPHFGWPHLNPIFFFNPLLDHLWVFLVCFACYALLHICGHSHSSPLICHYKSYLISTFAEPYRGTWRFVGLLPLQDRVNKMF